MPRMPSTNLSTQKKKRLASGDKLDSIMADLSSCQTEFWSHLQKFSHVLLNELKPQAIEVGKQLDEIRERRAQANLDHNQKQILRKAESDVRSQLETVYDQMVDIVTGKIKHDDAVTHQIIAQHKTISDQRDALNNSQTGGFAKANVAAVNAIREKQKSVLKPADAHPLADDEQQQLMLQFSWEDFDAVLQSSTLISQDITPTSWTGLGKVDPDGLKALFPNPDISLLMVMKHDELPLLSEVCKSSGLLTYLNPHRPNLLMEIPEDTNISKLADELPWCPHTVGKLTRAVALNGTSEVKRFAVMLAHQKSRQAQVRPQYLTFRFLHQGMKVAREAFSLPTAPNNRKAIHVPEKAMPTILKYPNLRGSQCTTQSGRVHSREPVFHTKIFHCDLTQQQVKKLVEKFHNLHYLSVMSVDEREGTVLGSCHTVLQAYYNATMKAECSPFLWTNLFTTMSEVILDRSLWFLQLDGYNNVRIGLHDATTAEAFIQQVSVELEAKGMLFKDERSRSWLRDKVGSDGESASSTAVDSSILYNVPGWMFQDEVETLSNSLKLGHDRLARLTSWNPGNANCTCWRLLGVSVPEGEVKVFQDSTSSTHLHLISYKEYCAMRNSSMKESQKKKATNSERTHRSYAKVVGRKQT